MERVAFAQLSKHLLDNQVLDTRQSAFRKNYSVEALLVNLADHILQQMDVGNITALILLDVSSAFDTVDHTILLNRLQSFSVTSHALSWFTSYLSNRFQRVAIDGTKSKPTVLTPRHPTGISWGSTPLLNIY